MVHLKGLSLTKDLYEPAETRIFGDIDILLRPKDIRTVLMLYSSDRFVVFFYPIKHCGSKNDEQIEVIEQSQYCAASNLILDSLQSAGIDLAFYLHKLSIGANMCYAAKRNFFFVGSDGMLSKCSFTDVGEQHNIVGNINSGVFQVDALKNLNYCVPDFPAMKSNGCFECSFLPTCFGMACPNANILTKGIRCPKAAVDLEEVIRREYEQARKRAS